jgi:RNA polymerase sigma-70 factor (ECF subfamily)
MSEIRFGFRAILPCRADGRRLGNFSRGCGEYHLRTADLMHDTDPSDDRIDVRLLAEIAAGVEQAFVELYRRRHHDVYRFAFAMAKSRSFAQDVTQEVFLNVLQNAARFDSAKGSVRAWLFGCARYVTLDRLRLERRWTADLPPDAAEPDSDERLFADQRIERLHAAIARLPMEFREALVLCELQELSYAETAAVLACPLGTVRSRLHRGRVILAALLDDKGQTATDPAASVAGPLQAREVCS